jgi:hypothetical protein
VCEPLTTQSPCAQPTPTAETRQRGPVPGGRPPVPLSPSVSVWNGRPPLAPRSTNRHSLGALPLVAVPRHHGAKTPPVKPGHLRPLKCGPLDRPVVRDACARWRKRAREHRGGRRTDGTARVAEQRFLLETTCGKQAPGPVRLAGRRERAEGERGGINRHRQGGSSSDCSRSRRSSRATTSWCANATACAGRSVSSVAARRPRARQAADAPRPDEGARAGAARGGAPSADQTSPRSSTTWPLTRARPRPRLPRAPASTAVSSSARPHGSPAPAGCGGHRRGIARSATSQPLSLDWRSQSRRFAARIPRSGNQVEVPESPIVRRSGGTPPRPRVGADLRAWASADDVQRRGRGRDRSTPAASVQRWRRHA